MFREPVPLNLPEDPDDSDIALAQPKAEAPSIDMIQNQQVEEFMQKANSGLPLTEEDIKLTQRNFTPQITKPANPDPWNQNGALERQGAHFSPADINSHLPISDEERVAKFIRETNTGKPLTKEDVVLTTEMLKKGVTQEVVNPVDRTEFPPKKAQEPVFTKEDFDLPAPINTPPQADQWRKAA